MNADERARAVIDKWHLDWQSPDAKVYGKFMVEQVTEQITQAEQAAREDERRETKEECALLARRTAQHHSDEGNKLKHAVFKDQAEYEFRRANTAHRIEQSIRAL